jgi:class 3 adenylate cyclase
MGVIQRKNLAESDETRTVQLGTVSLTRIGPHTLGRGVLQPGWRWSTHMAAAMGTSSCPVHHLQLLLSGRFAVRMDDGEEIELRPNDVVDIPPGHDAWVVGDEPAVMIDIAGNIGAIGLPQDHERVVTTLVFTDIVDSTKTAEQMGDSAWKQLLADHNRVVRLQVDRFRGTEIDTTGDGFVMTYGSAVSALRSALAIRDGIRELGLQVRIGVHTGEIERTPTEVTGINVHAAARIMGLAGPSQILVSSVARGLADGSGLMFRGAGRYEVKGLERPVEVAELLG